MLPYLIAMNEEFVLNSTGTWCVAMHERNAVKFAEEEMGKVVFYNLNAFGKPLKTAIFLGGMEYEYYANLLRGKSGNLDFPHFDQALYARIVQQKELFIMPGVVKGIGQFPDSEARLIESSQTYYLQDLEAGNCPAFFSEPDMLLAVLNLSLAIQTKVSLDRTDMQDGLPVFTEGGFSNNDAYNAILAAFYPKSQFAITNLREATAFGAAILGKSVMDQKHPKALSDYVHINKERVQTPELPGLEDYLEKYMSIVARS
jgi:sugar (pentulose or hexulose) kinase